MRKTVAVATNSLSHLEIRKLLAQRLPKILRGRLPYNLHPYQVDDLEAFIAWLKNKGAAKRGYYEWATGLGKTVEFCVIIAACQGLRVLVIESGKQLVSQTAKEVVKFTDESIAHASSVKKIETPDGDEILRWKNGGEHAVLVTTDESFKLSPQKFVEFNPDVIIWDECHWGFTKKAQHTLGLFPRSLVVGFTATADYLTTVAKSHFLPVTLENGQVLYANPDRMAKTHFGDRIAQRGLRWGIENKWLAPLAWGAIEFGFSLDEVPIVNTDAGFDYDEGALHKVLAKHWPLVINTVVKLYKSGQYDLANKHVAAICPGIDQAEELTKAIKKLGIAAECITNKTKDDERTRILEAADRGEVKFLASVFALREGWDCKLFEIALMLRPTQSRVLYIQFMGRVLRLLEDKVALVVDPFFLNTKFAPLSAPVLFGIPGQEVTRGDILIGPRGRKPPSPYLVKLIKQSTPKLVIEHPEIEYWADESGFFETDGERWGMVYSYQDALGISAAAIQNRIEGCRWKEGKSASGRLKKFYPFSEVESACADLLENLPVADKNGIFEIDGESWGNKDALAKNFGFSASMFEPRLSSCRCRKGKDSQKKITTFYAISDLRAACLDLISLPRAGEDGFFEADGEKWGTKAAIAKLLNIFNISVGRKIHAQRDLRVKKGRHADGRIFNFYPLLDVRTACAGLLEELPRAGEDGFFEADGEKWGTARALAKFLSLSSAVVLLARSSTCRNRLGFSGGRKYTFYALSDAKKACADILENLPKTKRDGTIEIDGEVWGHANALARVLGVSPPSVTSRCVNIKSMRARDCMGHPIVCYALSDVRRACVDVFKKKRDSTEK